MCLAQHSATVVIDVGGGLFIMFSPCHVDILHLSTASLNCRFSPRESPRNGMDFLVLRPPLIAENPSRNQKAFHRPLISRFQGDPDAPTGRHRTWSTYRPRTVRNSRLQSASGLITLTAPDTPSDLFIFNILRISSSGAA